MEKTTKTTTSKVNVYFRKKIEGNKDGYKVIQMNKLYAERNKLKSVPEFGDGSIDSGARTRVTANLELSYAPKVKNGKKEAEIKFLYMIASDDRKKKVDALGINSSFTIGLSQYDLPKRTRICGKKKYEITMSYTVDSDKAAFSFVYDKVPNIRGDWFNLTSKANWVESMKIKVDDLGSELTKEGNIGFEMVGYIPITVTRTITVSSSEPYEEIKEQILAKDKTTTTLKGLLSNRPKVDLVDGYTSPQIQEFPLDNPGAWICAEREANKLGKIQEFRIPKKAGVELYPGAIVRVNENLINGTPDFLPISTDERLPLEYACQLENEEVTFEAFKPDSKTFTSKFNSLKGNTKIKFIDSEIKYEESSKVTKNGFYAGCSLGNLSIGKVSLGGPFEIGLGSGNTKNVRIIEMRQKCFEVSLNDSYDSYESIFSDKLDIVKFKKNLEHYTPAIIKKVHYGKVAYIFLKSDDNSCFKVSLGDEGFIGRAHKKCEINVIAFGGSYNVIKAYQAKDAETFVEQFIQPIPTAEIASATPIAYEVAYLDQISKNISVKMNKYCLSYVDKIKVRVRGKNSGAAVFAQLKCYDVLDDMSYYYNYTPIHQAVFNDKCSLKVSPWATCIEADIDLADNRDKYDFNLFIPYIPLDQITEQDDEGNWVFNIDVRGTTIFNAKELSTPTPPMLGTYVSDDAIKYKYEERLEDVNEQQMLVKFFDFCEKRKNGYEDFSMIGDVRKKILVSRDKEN